MSEFAAERREPPADGVERLFIALTPPEAVRAFVAQLPERIAGVKWTPPEQYHVTLRFLGDVPMAAGERMLEELAEARVEPFVLPLEQVGVFPPNRPPRVVWLGTGAGHPRLFQLRQKIDDAVLRAGINLDVRTFHPHLTLARCSDAAAPALAHWLHARREVIAPPFRVDSFEVYASELQPSGAVHTLKRRYSLAEG